MAIQVTLECGHASMLRVRTTPEGYTHDWEVFVRGVDNADLSQYVDKVVFHLHETFPKPKRTLKEPPYMVKESGYAGFVIPIDVLLKNKDEPKKIQILYDLHLQPSGPAINNVIRHHESFVNPSEEFRKKLLKGGGVSVSNPEDPADKGDYKMVPPMVSKPKLSGTEVKKHRVTEVRGSNSFADLFGNPMTLPAKVSPESKKTSEKILSSKALPEKSEKIEKPTKPKHSPHKERKKEKSAEDRKDKKDRALAKEKERAKEKQKRPPSPGDKEEPLFPNVKKVSLPSPSKKQLAPSLPPVIQKPPSPRPKEKEHKKASSVDKDKERIKDNFKVPIEDRKFDRKKKKHKEDKSKERKEKDKDSDHDKIIKESTRKSDKKLVKSERHEKSEKERNSESKAPKDGRKSPKYGKDRDKSRIEKSDRSETMDKVKESRVDKEKQKHKHKRKDKKDRTEESAEKEKQKLSEKKNSYANSPSVNPLSTLLAEMPERDSSDSAHSVDEDSVSLVKSSSSPKHESDVLSTPVLSSDSSKPLSPRLTAEPKDEGEEKSRREKTKIARGEERESRKRKRKSDNSQDEIALKRDKDRGSSLSPSVEPVSSSQSPISVDVDSCYAKESASSHPENHNIAENEQVAPDSTNSAFADTETEGNVVFSDDYVSQLKELQQKIMTLQDNQELQRVVQVIAETGQYEVTRKTFDFDLCALDRATVQRLQQFFSAS